MQDMASGRTTENSILVLQAHHVDVVEVQEFGCFVVRPHIVLCERPSHPGRIVVTLFSVIDWERQQPSSPVLCGNRGAQISCECGDSTMSRKIIPDYCDSTGQRGL